MAVMLDSLPKGRKRGKKKGSAIAAAIILALASIMAFTGWKAFSLWQDYKNADDEYSDLTVKYTRVDISGAGSGELPEQIHPEEPAGQVDPRVPGVAGVDFPDLGVDHAGLYAVNPDYAGWLHIDDEIADIHISYPFLQGETNDEYLRTTMEGEHSSAGSVFVDENTPGDFSDHHTIIYGHNMLDGSMFSDLKKYTGTAEKEPERYFYIYLVDGSVLKCRLFSTHVVSKNSTVFQIKMSDALYAGFFERLLGESEDDWGFGGFDVGRLPEKTVTLSTCHGRSGTSRRMVVHAYVDTWYVDPAAVLPDMDAADAAEEPEEAIEEEGGGGDAQEHETDGSTGDAEN